MSQLLSSSTKSLRPKQNKPVPSCRQLAEDFTQLQQLRQKVQAAESQRKARGYLNNVPELTF
jgi:hypothetical protein